LPDNSEKKNLRKVLLEKRDSISYDYIEIASKQIHNKIKQIDIFRKAKNIGCYFPIGSEVKTQDLMQEVLASGKSLFLPKVVEDDLIFKKINDFTNLEKSSFNLMEPKDECPIAKEIDLVIAPIIGATRNGVRLGYGYGYYDRFLSKSKPATIGLTYSKQIIKSIPNSEKDIKMDWLVTEDEYFKISSQG